MPRLPRGQVAGHVYHVLNRGSGGATLQNLPFGGVAVLIMIGVGLDTVKQIESQLMQRSYEGFLR